MTWAPRLVSLEAQCWVAQGELLAARRRNDPDTVGAVLLLHGLGTDRDGPDASLTRLAEALAHHHIASLRIDQTSGTGRTRPLLRCATTGDLDLAGAGLTLLEQHTGVAASALGIEYSAAKVMKLALSGQVQAAALWSPDGRLYRRLDAHWSPRLARYDEEGRPLEGEPGFLVTFQELMASLENRVATVPVFALADVSGREPVDLAWFERADPGHQLLLVSAAGDPLRPSGSAGWNVDHTLARTVEWLRELPVRRLAASPRDEHGLLAAPAAPPSTLRDRTFISYRHKDGTEHAERADQHLRAAGIRCYLDRDALQNGNIADVIKRAMTDDCTGGVLVVTDDLPNSAFTNRHEVPRLLAQARHKGLALVVDNELGAPSQDLDPDAPDALLELPPDTLAGFSQYRLSVTDRQNEGMQRYLKQLLSDHLSPLQGEAIYLDVRTYGQPDQEGNRRSDLLIDGRVTVSRSAAEPAGNDDLTAMRLAFPLVSDALAGISPAKVVVTGSAHLSVALAVGGLLVDTRFHCPVVVKDAHGLWGQPEGEDDPKRHTLTHTWTPNPHGAASGRVAVYVDVADRPNDVFDRFLADLDLPIAGALRIRTLGGGFVQDTEGTRLVNQMARLIKGHCDTQASRARELLLMGPLTFPTALMLGRRLNTFTVRAYELATAAASDSDGHTESWYHPLLQLDAKDGQLCWVNAAPIPARRPERFGWPIGSASKTS